MADIHVPLTENCTFPCKQSQGRSDRHRPPGANVSPTPTKMTRARLPPATPAPAYLGQPSHSIYCNKSKVLVLQRPNGPGGPRSKGTTNLTEVADTIRAIDHYGRVPPATRAPAAAGVSGIHGRHVTSEQRNDGKRCRSVDGEHLSFRIRSRHRPGLVKLASRHRHGRVPAPAHVHAAQSHTISDAQRQGRHVSRVPAARTEQRTTIRP